MRQIISMYMLLSRARRLTWKEIHFRIAQKLNNLIDRILVSRRSPLNNGEINLRNSVIREVDFFLDSARFDGTERRFFASFCDQGETRDLITSHFSGNLETAIKNAELIITKKIPIFGYDGIFFGSPVCWHFDALSGKKAAKKFWTDIKFLDYEETGDHKVIWELNRHQYLQNLGKAYWITGDEKYTREWINQINDWMDSNPPKIGINWASSLEVALRSIAWIWCFLFFKNSKTVSHNFWLKYFSFLIFNGLHIERNLSCYFAPNTHLTGEALGLFYLGLLFSLTKNGDRWLKKGISILLDQLENHVQGDGVYFEQSTYYHRYSTDFYLHLHILMQRNSMSIPSVLTYKLQQLLDFLVLTQKPNGKTPILGDDDGGRLLFLNHDDYDDFRSCLSTGAVLFGRADYKELSGGFSEETLWLLGSSAYEIYDSLESARPSKTSVSFPAGGYYVMRNGWDKNAAYLMVDCGPHGWNTCGHAHSDLLSVVASVDGKELLIDPGTFTYTTSAEWRNKFRGSLAHNTVCVDNLSQSEPGGPFSWESIATPVTCFWVAHQDFDFFSGQSSIYIYFPQPVSHQRDIFFVKEKAFWVILDKVMLDASRDISLRFHFSSTEVDLRENNFVVSDDTRPFGAVSIFSSSPFHLSVVDDWWSPIYSVKEPAMTGLCQLRGTASASIVTVIGPGPGQSTWKYSNTGHVASLVARDQTRTEVNTFVINQEGGLKAASKGLSSDFSWAWLHSNRHEAKERLTLVRGSQITVDHAFHLSLAKKVDYLVVERSQSVVSVNFVPESAYEWKPLNRSLSLRINGRKVQ